MSFKKTALSSLFIALEAIFFYLLLIIPGEYLLTEKFLVFKYIRPATKTYILLGVFLLTFVIHQKWKKAFSWERRFWPAIAVLFVAALFANRAYSSFYQGLQRYPKIYSLSSDWSIVGMEIVIDGKNFGPAWKKGEVLVDDFPFLVKEWSEEKIVAVQPVPPMSHYFKGKMYVIKENGEKSNKVPFNVRDPGELHRKDSAF